MALARQGYPVVIKIEEEDVVTEVVEPSEPSDGTAVDPQHSETGKTPPRLDCHLCPFIAESETALLDHIRGHSRPVTSASSESAVGQQTPELIIASNVVGQQTAKSSTASNVVGQQTPELSTARNVVGQQTPKLFTASNGEVYLGEGLYMPEAKLTRILKSKSELRAARDTARHFWSKGEMKIRSLTGQPCRSISDSVAKQVATPEKVAAVMNVVRKVVNDNPTEVPAAKRVAIGKKAIRDLFADTARIRSKGAIVQH
ncbi:uncharacterized protein LOC144160137 [Haemaphysalis longicornis]